MKTFFVFGLLMAFASGLPKKKSDDSDLIPIPENFLNDFKTEPDDLNEVEVTESSADTKQATVEKVNSGEKLEIPIFLKEPSDTFLIKSKPATLHCRVAHALRVFFQCNSENVEPSNREDHVEPETGVRYTEASVEITRDHVEEYFQEFHCACVAISAKGSVVSRHALVTNAYLKKHFEVPPYSQQVSRGGQVEVRCHPPKGRPTPHISWLQNNKQIEPNSDKNFIVTGEGHLIIVAARLTDTANYTCVAENVASKRFSDPAAITVYVDGEWSAWGLWSSCSPRCGKGVQKRLRTCDSPAPINGGQPCAGSPVQKKPCSNDCPGISGGWSDWSSWSSCSPECFQHRRRTCTNPEPFQNGLYCEGIDLQSRNCSHGFCQGTGQQLVMYGEAPSDNGLPTDQETNNTDLTLYIVFGVALLVFILVLIIIVKILKRKNPNPNGYTLTSTDYGYSDGNPKKSVGLGYSPDITHHHVVGTVGSSGTSHSASNGKGHMTPTTVCYEYSYPDSNSNHSKSGFLRPLSEHHYEQPMVVLPPSSQSPSDSLDKPSRSDTSSSISNNGNTTPLVTSTPLPALITPPPPPPTNPPPQSSSFKSSKLPSDPKFTVWSSVTSAGARIHLAECEVTVTIPPGAVSQGRSVDLFVSVIHQGKPPLSSPRETLLSPIVTIGPREVQLKKSVILSMPHCASLRSFSGNWRISLLQSEDLINDNDHLRPWCKSVTLGQETLNTPSYVQLDVNNAHIMTDILASYALVGESVPNKMAGKTLQLAAFAQESGHRGPDLTVRIYVLPDTSAALSQVYESEKRYNGRLLDKPLSFLFMDGGHDLCLQVEDVNWSFQKGADYCQVPFNHIWSSSNPNLHCSFTFRNLSQEYSRFSQDTLSLCIGVSQKNSEKNLLRVNCDLSRGPSMSLNRNQSNNNNFVAESGRFRLNANMISNLSKLLDPPTSEGHDWRLLAERLNVHRYVTFFATRPSPTEAILNLWEARNREILALSNLINILRGMGRFDAAQVLEQQN